MFSTRVSGREVPAFGATVDRPWRRLLEPAQEGVGLRRRALGECGPALQARPPVRRSRHRLQRLLAGGAAFHVPLKLFACSVALAVAAIAKRSKEALELVPARALCHWSPSKLADLFSDHLLDGAFGPVHPRDLHFQPLGGGRPRQALKRRQPESLPRPRRDALPHTLHRTVHHLPLELQIQLFDQVVAGLETREELRDAAVAGSEARPAAIGRQVTPGMMRERFQPTTEAARRVVDECAPSVR